MDGAVKSETAKLRAEIDSPETAAKLQQYDDLMVMRDNVNAYAQSVKFTTEAYKSLPVVCREYYEAIDEAVANVIEANEGTKDPAVITEMTYANGEFTIPITVKSTDEFAQKYPAALVQYIYDNYGDKFSHVEYVGYIAADVTPSEAQPGAAARPGATGKQVDFNLVLQVNNEKQLPNVQAETEDASDPAAE
jgi:hypothetical protein